MTENMSYDISQSFLVLSSVLELLLLSYFPSSISIIQFPIFCEPTENENEGLRENYFLVPHSGVPGPSVIEIHSGDMRMSFFILE